MTGDAGEQEWMIGAPAAFSSRCQRARFASGYRHVETPSRTVGYVLCSIGADSATSPSLERRYGRRWERFSGLVCRLVPTGYSGTPLARKLGVRPRHVLALVDAPEGWGIPDLDPSVQVRRDLQRRSDVIIAFVRRQRDLDRWSPRLVQAVDAEAALWVAWPRKAGGHASDLTEQALRDMFLPVGLVDNKVAALDNDWSGLRFVWRRERREAMRAGS